MLPMLFWLLHHLNQNLPFAIGLLRRFRFLFSRALAISGMLVLRVASQHVQEPVSVFLARADTVLPCQLHQPGISTHRNITVIAVIPPYRVLLEACRMGSVCCGLRYGRCYGFATVAHKALPHGQCHHVLRLSPRGGGCLHGNATRCNSVFASFALQRRSLRRIAPSCSELGVGTKTRHAAHGRHARSSCKGEAGQERAPPSFSEGAVLWLVSMWRSCRLCRQCAQALPKAVVWFVHLVFVGPLCVLLAWCGCHGAALGLFVL